MIALALATALSTADLGSVMSQLWEVERYENRKELVIPDYCQYQAQAESAAIDLRRAALKGEVLILDPGLKEKVGAAFYKLTDADKKAFEAKAMGYETAAKQHGVHCRRR